jgi:hypothetical protein
MKKKSNARHSEGVPALAEDDRENLRGCLKNGRRDWHVASLLTMTDSDAFGVYQQPPFKGGILTF